MSVRKDEIPQQSSAPLEGSLQQKLCLPGFYMEEASGGCALCADGIDYTNHSNTLPSCLPCMTCKSGEEEKNRCTPTKDTECQCKPGTFRGEDAPEFCQKCSTGCPDGKVMVTHCNPWSNIKCVDQESGTLAHGEAPVPGELGTPSPSSGTSRLVIGIVSGITIVLVGCVVWCFFNGREADRITPSPEMQQAGCLLEPAAPEGSQRRRWLLVPTDGTQSLKLFFSDFAAIFSL
ncbi:PREDICTED: tumor necrosis factor receptor superfamily member 10B-like isoform X1 [Capra hircus]|uniref:tumor necrosis factor receptor superfamily member 10B-like isoform X1 n=1 Tax=Capra hircus TaxID=9925 RepID=UPI0008466423|nr:PREDICTED: tumor necrosis factor receptor superfamily member 10B-like isoform X1 [Capra hircus]